jgi:hypothetical protein
MKNYFFLQLKLINRKFKDSTGVHPIISYLILLSCFIFFSIYLFIKTQYAQYLYISIPFVLTTILSETTRIDFLKLCFQKKQYSIIRISENIFVSSPFLIFLIYKNCYLSASTLLILSILNSFIQYPSNTNLTIPTPFSKTPFEFPVGFRKTFYLFPLIYSLTFFASSIDNFNLSVFSLILVFIIIFTFYSKPENEYFVWSFNSTPIHFLISKIKTGILFSTMLSLPVIAILSFNYFENLFIIFTFYFLGIVFLMTIISAKYAAFPNEMNLPEGIILALCVSAPPLLLLFTPYFFIKASKTLKRQLE